MNNAYFSVVEKALGWAKAGSLWYFSTGGGCCADELFETESCRYDLERFGCLPQVDPRQADLLIVSGMISYKAAEELKKVYDQMLSPKYVIALGACACSGGLFSGKTGYSVLPGAHELFSVDVFVPGCPPRPEALMNGIITLQEKICGSEPTQRQN